MRNFHNRNRNWFFNGRKAFYSILSVTILFSIFGGALELLGLLFGNSVIVGVLVGMTFGLMIGFVMLPFYYDYYDHR